MDTCKGLQIPSLVVTYIKKIIQNAMRITAFPLVLFLFLLNTNCSKTKSFSIDVSKITVTDAFGNSAGEVDPSDWGFDAEWSETEKSFFLADPVDLSESKQATITMLPAYPNPTSNRLITFRFNSTDTSFVKVALVDEKLKRLAFYSLKIYAGLNVFNFSFPESLFPARRNYRLYYSFDTFSNPGYFKGHGDISVQ